jgi:hypothetical protein
MGGIDDLRSQISAIRANLYTGKYGEILDKIQAAILTANSLPQEETFSDRAQSQQDQKKQVQVQQAQIISLTTFLEDLLNFYKEIAVNITEQDVKNRVKMAQGIRLLLPVYEAALQKNPLLHDYVDTYNAFKASADRIFLPFVQDTSIKKPIHIFNLKQLDENLKTESDDSIKTKLFTLIIPQKNNALSFNALRLLVLRDHLDLATYFLTQMGEMGVNIDQAVKDKITTIFNKRLQQSSTDFFNNFASLFDQYKRKPVEQGIIRAYFLGTLQRFLNLPEAEVSEKTINDLRDLLSRSICTDAGGGFSIASFLRKSQPTPTYNAVKLMLDDAKLRLARQRQLAEQAQTTSDKDVTASDLGKLSRPSTGETHSTPPHDLSKGRKSSIDQNGWTEVTTGEPTQWKAG